jgi:hypothetical protein
VNGTGPVARFVARAARNSCAVGQAAPPAKSCRSGRLCGIAFLCETDNFCGKPWKAAVNESGNKSPSHNTVGMEFNDINK